MTILTAAAVNKDIKSKIKFCRQSGGNVLKFFDNMPRSPFTTSEAKSD